MTSAILPFEADLTPGTRNIGWCLTVKVPCGFEGCTEIMALKFEPMATINEGEIVLESNFQQRKTHICPACNYQRSLSPEETSQAVRRCEGEYLRKSASDPVPPKS